MRVVTLSGALILLAACSSNASNTTTGAGGSAETQQAEVVSCVTPGASYVLTWNERSGGTCGPVPDSVVNVGTDGTVSVPANCTGENRVEGCNVFLTNWDCPAEDGARIKQTGSVQWAKDGSTGAGIVQFTVTFPDGDSCVSSYRMTYTRQ